MLELNKLDYAQNEMIAKWNECWNHLEVCLCIIQNCKLVSQGGQVGYALHFYAGCLGLTPAGVTHR